MGDKIFTKSVSCRLPLWVIVWLVLIPLDRDTAVSAEKATIGAVENVVVLPWKITLLARIDTGAAFSSIDARDIRVKDNTVEFKLFERGGEQAIRLPIVRWRNIRTSEGEERRPVVRLQLCIGTELLTAAVNLNDRSKMEYSLLIGRNALAGRFVVDVGHHKMLAPNCLEGHAR